MGSDAKLECIACSAIYPVCDGIVDFRCHRRDYYFNPIPRGEMGELTREANYQPWASTVRRFLKGVGQNPDWFDNLVADGRYAWKLLLRLSPDAQVLDLGCGLGNLTKNIASSVGRVYALDLTFERLEFARVRFRHFNPNDDIALLAGGDGTYLPFPDNSLDCVTLSGVLEWIADDDSAWNRGTTRLQKAVGAFLSFFGATNPRKMQIRFLKEIRRILKPEGQLFIAIENRLNYRYFGGRRDHHSGLWFGSLLPRFLANLYSILVTHRPYRTYTYSISGYRRLLKAAGFLSQEICGLTPGYTHLAELIPFQMRSHLWRPLKFQGYDWLRRSQRFVPAYGIIASREASSRLSLAEQLAMALESQLVGTEGKAAFFTRFRITGKSKGIINGQVGRWPMVIKLPFNDSAVAGAERNYQFLEQAEQIGKLRVFVPRALARGEIQGVRYYAEASVEGRLLRAELGAHNHVVYLDDVSNFLQALNPNLHEQAPEALSGEFYQRQVLAPLEQIGRVLNAPVLMEEARAYFQERFDGLSVRCGIVHGDLSVSNIFIGDSGITGVIDWDSTDFAGIPVLDALNYLESTHRHLNPGIRPVQAISRLAHRERLAEREQQFLEESYHRCGIDFSYHFSFMYFYWLRHVAQQLDDDLIYNMPALEERIVRVLEHLLTSPC